MPKPSRRLLPVALALFLAAGTILPVPLLRFTPDMDESREAGESGGKTEFARGRSASFARHLDRLTRAIPGNVSEPEEGPGGAAEERFEQLVYPADDLPLAHLAGARAAFADVKARGVGRGRNSTDTWFELGPTSAVYQETRFRRASYVPSRYLAGGRVTAMAIGHSCTINQCRVWMAAAGGGVWRTDNALQGTPSWTFLTGTIGINAIGSIAVDPSDDDVVWIGTGEANASGDSAAGVGIYRSTDGGNTWGDPLGATEFSGRAVGTIALNPNNPKIVYAGSTRGVRGVSSVTGGGVTLIPGAAIWGLYKSTDGGATWSYIHNGAAAVCPQTPTTIAGNTTPCSARGLRRVVIDPGNANIVYASSYGRGVWRSTDGGATWTQIKTPLIPLAAATNTIDRAEIAVNLLPNGSTRMYLSEGSQGETINGIRYYSRLFRSDSVATGAPVFTDLTSPDPANQGYGSFDFCTGQCWYDQFVVTPAGHPDLVFLGGSYSYNEVGRVSNGRAVGLSIDAGVSFTDLTEDATNRFSPNGMHPDQHTLVVNPAYPLQFFEGSDGGVIRSDGGLEDTSARCADRELTDPALARCRQLLSAVPKRLDSLNKGLNTLQFQSLSVNPGNANNVMGGTQDNGTFETTGSTRVWQQTFWGDGGQSGFDIANRLFRFHTFFNATPDVNFTGGALQDWNWIGDRLYFGGEPQAFYVPINSDPVVSGTMFAGLGHVWRTTTHGAGPGGIAALRAVCNEFFGSFDDICGDWRPLGATSYPDVPPAFPNLPNPASYSATRLTASGALYGTDRSGGTVAAVERSAGDASTLWAATSTGRVFISKNANAALAKDVTFRRLDPLSTVDPNRFVSSIHVDPANPNRAFVSYSGFNANTPAQPGHVFAVVYDPNASTASWTSLDFDILDLPVNDLVRDDPRGDLYAATDFGVMRLAAGATTWTLAADGLPAIEVTGLTIETSARKLFAATHGRGAWSLTLP